MVKQKILTERLDPIRVPTGTNARIKKICANKKSPSEWIRNAILKAIEEDERK